MTTSADPDHFFQTTHSLAEISRRTAKSRNDYGHPIRLPSKILAVIADPTSSSSSYAVYVAESAGTARRVLLDEGSIDHTFTGPPAPLTSLTLSPDGKLLFAGCWDKSIWSWNVSTRAKGKRYVNGHTDFVKCVLCVRIAGKDVLISGGADAALVVWDAESGTRLHTLRSHVRGIQDLALDPLTYDPSAEQVTIFSAGSVGEIRRWDIGIAHAMEIEKEKPTMVHETSVYKLLFDGDGDLWSASADGSVKCLSRERGKGWEVEMSVHIGGWVRGVGVEEVGGWVVAGGRDERVGVWNIGTGKLVHTFEGHYDEITGLVVMGQTVVSVSLDGTIRRWSLKAGDLNAAKREAQEEKEGVGLERGEKFEERLMTEEEEMQLAELMDEDGED